MSKPKIFIGSSTEGIDVANAVFSNLERFAEVTVWAHDVFKLAVPIITSLMRSLDNAEYAIFVFTPDDVSTIRGDQQNIVRDNVIFETGLFAGRLGTEKVFFLKPENIPLHLPSDLLGVVAGEYPTTRIDGNLIAATTTFCSKVKRIINELSQRPGPGNDDELEKHLKLLQIHLKRKGWTSMSFLKIAENVHPALTEEYLMKIVEAFPEKITRCRLAEGKFGITLHTFE